MIQVKGKLHIYLIYYLDILDKFILILSQTIKNDRTEELLKEVEELNGEKAQMIKEINYLLGMDQVHIDKQGKPNVS